MISAESLKEEKLKTQQLNQEIFNLKKINFLLFPYVLLAFILLFLFLKSFLSFLMIVLSLCGLLYEINEKDKNNFILKEKEIELKKIELMISRKKENMAKLEKTTEIKRIESPSLLNKNQDLVDLNQKRQKISENKDTKDARFFLSNSDGKQKWIQKNSNIKIGNFTLNGLFYITERDVSNKIKSAINLKLKTEIPYQYNYSLPIGYYPNYEYLTPVQRATYLKLLENGFNALTLDIGYVFLYFYGLEYRFFKEYNELEANEIIEEVKRLRVLFKENKSFNSYSSKFLLYAEFLKHKEKVALNEDYFLNSEELSFYIAILTNRKENISKEIVLKYIKLCGFLSRSVIPSRCENEFKELFYYEFDKKYPAGLECKQQKRIIKIQYYSCSGNFEKAIFNIPSAIYGEYTFCNRFSKIIDKCCEKLSEYSKYIYKDNTSFYRKFLLPLEISSIDKELDLFINEIEDEISKIGFYKIEYDKLLEKIGKESLSLKEYEKILKFLEKYNLSCFPNLSLDKVSSEKNVLFIFKCSNLNIFESKGRFYMLDMIVRFNAISNGRYDNIIVEFINKGFLGEEEKNILNIRKFFSQTLVDEKNIFSKIKLLSNEEKTIFLNFFGSYLREDMEIFKIVQKEYLNSGFDKDDFYNCAMGSGKINNEPIIVSENFENKGFKIPKKKEVKVDFLDKKVLQEKLNETKDIHVVLNNILGEEKINNSLEKKNLKANLNTQSPFLKYKDFILFISNKQIWEKEELEIEAKKQKIFLNKFIDDVNDYAIKEYDHTLIDEDGDMFEVSENLKNIL